MKKVLITLLVLGLASFANAGMILGVGGEPAPAEIMASDVVQVWGVDTVPNSASLVVGGFGDVTITGASLVYGGSLGEVQTAAEYAAFLGYADADALLADFEAFGLTGINDLLSITLADGAVPPASLAGLMVDDITLGDGLGELQLIDGTTFEVLQSANVVPEPMTIALLGLGGLFLRRRK